MNWQALSVVWRLKTPLHAGRGKVGNLQLTRPYITGRMVWGALTERLARLDAALAGRPAVETDQYHIADVHRWARFSYFFPALLVNGRYVPHWPAQDEGLFRYQFLDSYVSTASDYARKGALDASLHEVECILPQTRPVDGTGASLPVCLVGVLFVREDVTIAWQDAIGRLQLGGERGYGWGRVELAQQASPITDLFGYALDLANDEPIVSVPDGGYLLAHTVATDVEAKGKIEPLVGREWGDGEMGQGAGQRLVLANICYAPGSRVLSNHDFRIGRYGIWEKVSYATP